MLSPYYRLIVDIEMSYKFIKLRLWWQKHVPMPLLLIGTVVITVLFLNDETSISRNYEYQREIVELKKQIKLNNDSADYYHRKRNALKASPSDLEHLAREQYHMQKADEEVYLLRTSSDE